MRRWLCSLFVTVVASVAGIAGAQGDADRDPIARALEREIDERLQLPPESHLEVEIEDGRVIKVELYLNAVPDVAADPTDADTYRRAVRRWADAVHEQTFAISRAFVKREATDPDFSPETDFGLDIVGDCSFKYRGSRLTYSLDDPQALGFRKVDPNDAPEGVELTVEISPEKEVWDVREAIRGTHVLRNTGTRRIPISRWHLDDVTIEPTDGAAIKRFAMRGHISYAPPKWHNKYLMPDESYTGTWVIHTDPRKGLVTGYVVPEGKHVLTHHDLLSQYNIRTKVTPVPIEVRRTPGAYIGPRIVDVRACGRYLVLLRERAIIEVVDTESGDRLCTKVLPGYRHDWIWGGARAVLGPDARYVAYCPKRDAEIRMIDLHGARPALDILTPPEDFEVGVGGFSAKWFDPDARTMLAATNHRWVELDLATGEPTSRAETALMWWSVSPDGRYLVDTEGGGIRFVGMRGDDTYTVTTVRRDGSEPERVVTIEGHGDAPDSYLGLRGTYLTDEFNEGVLYLPYDADELITFDTGHVAVQAESPDGTLVAFMAPGGPKLEHHRGSTTIEVWDVATRMKVYEVDGEGDHLRAMFLSHPTRLVCAPLTFTEGVRCFAEVVRIHEPHAGVLLHEIDLTPDRDDLGLDLSGR